MEKETLNLVVNKKWFDQIAAGVKKEEYREIKRYWITRLTNQQPDGSIKYDSFYKSFRFVRFKNGYNKNAPYLLVEFNGIEMKDGFLHEHFGNDHLSVFVIKLGNVLFKSY